MVLILPHLVWDLYCHVLLLEVTSIRKVELSVIFQLSYHVLLFFYCLSAWTHFLSFATATASTTLLYGDSYAATFFCCYPAILVWQQLLLLWWVKWYEDISSLFSSPLLSSLLLSSLLFGSSCCSFAELNYMQTSLLSSTHLSSPLFSSLLFSSLFSLVWQQQLLLFWFK